MFRPIWDDLASARQMALGASMHDGRLAVGNELGHWRMLSGIPVGRIEDVVDLFEGCRAFGAATTTCLARPSSGGG